MRKLVFLLSMIMLCSTLAFSQDRNITGTVKDEAGAAIPAASIRIKGTKTGVAADNNGQFRILAKAGDVLLVTATGIEATEVVVGASNAILITVKNIISSGQEVVVTG